MKGYEITARALRECHVDPVFGLMGDANMCYLATLMHDEGVRYVSSVDEGGAVSMADGFSRLSGRVGVASITHGPAATNAITAMVEAVRASSRLLVISGDTPAERNHWQRINLEHVAALAGADYWRVLQTKHIADDIAMVIARVSATSRPLLLDLPIDLQYGEAEYHRPDYRVPARQAFLPDDDALDQALGVIASGQRPIILAGHGAVLAGARDALVELADLLDAPLATTVLAKDMFRGHPYDLGFMGSLSTPQASTVITRADCVVVFGAGLNERTTENGGLLKGAAIVRCDASPEALSRNQPATVALLGDARAVAERMTAGLRAAGFSGHRFRVDAMGPGGVAEPATLTPDTDDATVSSGAALDIRTAMIRLDEILPKQRVLITDAGRFVPAPWRHLHVTDATLFSQTCGNWGCVGLGLATTIGAACAVPELLTVGVVGDGGGMMGLAEFSSAVRNNIPLVIVVLNDGAYGAEYTKLADHGLDPKYSLLEWPEFAEVARALGGDGIRVDSLADFDEVGRRVATLTRPLLIDIKCDPTVRPS